MWLRAVLMSVGVCLPQAATAGELQAHRDLTEVAAEMELAIRGPWIDFGSADQHKYTLGGWKTGWGDGGRIEDDDARVHVMLRERPQEVALRIRSRARRQRVTVRAGGETLGRASVGKRWKVVRFAADELPERGRVTIELDLRRDGAEVDWLWLRTSGRKKAPRQTPRVGRVAIGGVAFESLLAPAPRSYGYFMRVPDGASLLFWYGSQKGADMVVRAETAGGETHELLAERAPAGRWMPAQIDLSRFAGQVVRLELATTKGAAAWGEPTIAVPLGGGDRRARWMSRRPKNVVVIVLDTTRADAFATVSPKTAVKTPAFDRFAKTSLAFSDAYNNATWTKPSVTTLLSGLHPRTHRVHYVKNVVPKNVELLPEYLKGRGFHTAAFTANPVVSDKFGFDQGWDLMDAVSGGMATRGAEDLYGAAIEWLEKKRPRDEPFFLYVQSNDAHAPYNPDRELSRPYHPDEYTGRYGAVFSAKEQNQIRFDGVEPSRADYAWIRALYRAEVTYQDRYFGELIAAIDRLGLTEETLVLVTNDHGEEIGDHGSVGHTWQTYGEVVRAPLAIRVPGLSPRPIREVAHHADVAPTIVDLLGLPPMPDAEGSSMVPLLTGYGSAGERVATVDFQTEVRAARAGDWKLAVEKDGSWKYLYDVEGDPREQRDRREDRELAGRFVEIHLSRELAASADPMRAGVRKRTQPEERELDDETRRQLEALGYIDGDE